MAQVAAQVERLGVSQGLFGLRTNMTQADIRHATREFLQAGGKRQIGNIINEHMQDKVQRGLCAAHN